MTAQTQRMMKRATAILPATSDELLMRGIAAEATDRIVVLKKSERLLETKYESVDRLEEAVREHGVTPDDHTPYTDLLEWRALRHDLSQSLELLESM